MFEIIINIIISLFLKLFFTAFYPLMDWKLYGEKYEEGIQKGKDPGKFYKWLFKVYDWKMFPGAVPRYRVLQKSVLIGYWLFCYYYFYQYLPFWILFIDVIIGVFVFLFYFMVFENMYYRYGNQWQLLLSYEEIKYKDGKWENENIYWLTRGWFIGLLVFVKRITETGATDYGFRRDKFDRCFYIGIALSILTSLIYLIK